VIALRSSGTFVHAIYYSSRSETEEAFYQQQVQLTRSRTSTPPRRWKALEIKANIDALQVSIDLHNNPADVKKLQEASRDLRSITPLPRPTSWQVTQVKQDLL
jgi:hypothetical protein